MPVELGGYLFRRVIRILHIIGAIERRDGLIESTDAPQIVPPHVMRVRYVGGEPGIRFTVLECGPDLVQIFVRVSEIVMRSAVIRRNPQRLLIEGRRGRTAALATTGRRWFFSIAANQPQLCVTDIGRERPVDRLFVLGKQGGVAEIRNGLELLQSQGDASPLADARA